MILSKMLTSEQAVVVRRESSFAIRAASWATTAVSSGRVSLARSPSVTQIAAPSRAFAEQAFEPVERRIIGAMGRTPVATSASPTALVKRL